jgi:hypothetical protein
VTTPTPRAVPAPPAGTPPLAPPNGPGGTATGTTGTRR